MPPDGTEFCEEFITVVTSAVQMSAESAFRGDVGREADGHKREALVHGTESDVTAGAIITTLKTCKMHDLSNSYGIKSPSAESPSFSAKSQRKRSSQIPKGIHCAELILTITMLFCWTVAKCFTVHTTYVRLSNGG